MVRRRTFLPGERIVTEGAETTEAYVIERGHVEVYRGREHPQRLRELGPGDIFGEMALLTDEPRSASVRAVDQVDVRVIDRDDLAAIFRDDPTALLPVFRVLCDRVRALTVVVAETSRQFAECRESVRVHLSEEGPSSIARPTVVLEGLTPEAIRALDTAPLTIGRWPFRIGRRADGDALMQNELALPDSAPFHVSRAHCALALAHGRCFVIDRGSRRGTLVNGQLLGVGSYRAELHLGANELAVGGARSPYRFMLTWSAAAVAETGATSTHASNDA